MDHHARMTTRLSAESVTIGYGGRAILRDVSFELRAGELVALIGANGSGKSSLLRTLAGLHAPLRGVLRLAGLDPYACTANERARRLAIVLPGRSGIFGVDVLDLVALGRQPWTDRFGRLTAEDLRIVDRALDLAGVGALRDREVASLSDGECQNVMIARALAQDTPVLLLDEPTAHLDLIHRVRTVRLLAAQAHDNMRTVLFSTHDLRMALRHCDRLLIARRDGSLWYGTPVQGAGNGVIAAEFSGEGLRFDPDAGDLLPAPNEGPRSPEGRGGVL